MEDIADATRCVFSASNAIVDLPKDEQKQRAFEIFENFIHTLREPQPPQNPPCFDETPEIILTRYVDAFTPATPNVLDASADHHRKWYTSVDAMVKGQERILCYFLREGKSFETAAMEEYIKRVMLQVVIPRFHEKKNTSIVYTLEATYRQFMYLVFASILTGIAAKTIEDEKIRKQVSIETSCLRNTSIKSSELLKFIKRLVVSEPKVVTESCPGTKKCDLCFAAATERAKLVVDLKKPHTDTDRAGNPNSENVSRYVFCKEHKKLAESLCTLLLFETIMRKSVVPNALLELQKEKGDTCTPNDVFNHIVKNQVQSIRAAYTYILRELGEYFPYVPSEARAMEMMGTFIPCEIDVSDPRFNPNNLPVKYDKRSYAHKDQPNQSTSTRKRTRSNKKEKETSGESMKYAKLIKI